MAYAYVGSANTYNNAGGTNPTVSYSPTVGNTLLVAGAFGYSPTNSVSDGSNTYSLIGTGVGSDSISLFTAKVTTGGPLTIQWTGTATAIYGVYVAEYSGLGAYISGSFQNQEVSGPGNSTPNTIVTASNVGVTSAPAMLWGFTIDEGIISGGGAANAPIAGTTLAYTSRTTGWLGATGGATATSVAEDIRITSTGSYPVAFTCGNVYNTFNVIGAAFTENVNTATVAWLT